MKVCKECGTCLEDSSPITAEWLREVWGAVDGRMPGDLVIGPIVRGINKEIGKPYWMVRSWTITHDLTTRQQFCDLARCLGIPRRPSKSEPGCTCLDSPNMLYAPCSYCEQRRKDGE